MVIKRHTRGESHVSSEQFLLVLKRQGGGRHAPKKQHFSHHAVLPTIAPKKLDQPEQLSSSTRPPSRKTRSWLISAGPTNA